MAFYFPRDPFVVRWVKAVNVNLSKRIEGSGCGAGEGGGGGSFVANTCEIVEGLNEALNQ